CDVINRHFTPRLFGLNGMPIDKLPVVTHTKIQETPIEEIAALITSLAGAGMALFPSEDGELERWSLALIDAPTTQTNTMEGRNTAPTGAKLGPRSQAPTEPEPQIETAPTVGGPRPAPAAAQRNAQTQSQVAAQRDRSQGNGGS